MRDSLQDISWQELDTVTGGSIFTGTATAGSRRGSSSSSSSQTQLALQGVTSALDSLKQNQNKNGSLDQLLPIAIMAKWMRQNG